MKDNFPREFRPEYKVCGDVPIVEFDTEEVRCEIYDGVFIQTVIALRAGRNFSDEFDLIKREII